MIILLLEIKGEKSVCLEIDIVCCSNSIHEVVLAVLGAWGQHLSVHLKSKSSIKNERDDDISTSHAEKLLHMSLNCDPPSFKGNDGQVGRRDPFRHDGRTGNGTKIQFPDYLLFFEMLKKW